METLLIFRRCPWQIVIDGLPITLNRLPMVCPKIISGTVNSDTVYFLITFQYTKVVSLLCHALPATVFLTHSRTSSPLVYSRTSSSLAPRTHALAPLSPSLTPTTNIPSSLRSNLMVSKIKSEKAWTICQHSRKPCVNLPAPSSLIQLEWRLR